MIATREPVDSNVEAAGKIAKVSGDGFSVSSQGISPRRRPARFRILRAATYLLALVLAVESLAPVLWMVVSAISTKRELLSVPPHWIPQHPTLSNLLPLVTGNPIAYRGVGDVSAPIKAFGHGIVNSLVLATLTTLLCLIAGTLGAYGFARLRFRLHNSLFFLVLAVQMIPSISILVPLYVMLRRVGLLDSYIGMILVYSTFTVGTVTWVMTGYMASIPSQLDEAARVDGCTRLQALRLIVLPVVTPGLVATGALAFLASWNEFIFALTFTSFRVKTLPVVIAEFSTQFSLEYGLMMAGGLIAIAPPILLALIFQRHIVAGLSSGGVKG